MSDAPDRFGVSVRRSPDGEASVSFLSRGDRVRGRVRVHASPSAPLVLLGPPDGAAFGAYADAALRSWCAWGSIATFDLPLCGGRRSEKLTAVAFDPGVDLARALRADLEAQLEWDLAIALDWLAEELRPPPPHTAFVGLGRSAGLARAFCERESRLDAALLAVEPAHALVLTRGSDGDRVFERTLPSFDPRPPALDSIARLLRAALED
jgi:hypothetical protein